MASMSQLREKVLTVKVVRPYIIEVTFNDKTTRQIDLESELQGEAFSPLRDYGLFSQAAVDPIFGSVYWPTGADLAPEFLYYGYDTPYGSIAREAPAQTDPAVSTRH